MRGITYCFRSVHDTPTPCGERTHWPTWTTRRRRRGTGERWEFPTTMHPLRVGGSERRLLADRTVDEIIKIGRWKTEKVGNFCVGSTACTRIQPSKRKRDHACATASELPLPPAVELVFSALTYASIIHSTKQVWVRQGSARLVANDELRNAKRPHPIKYLY